MTIYYAPRPKIRWQDVALRVACPFILIWDLLQLTMMGLFGKGIGRAVLPAQSYVFTPGYFLSTDDAWMPPKPKWTWRLWTGFKKIASCILFPPLLVGDIFNFLCRCCCSKTDVSNECVKNEYLRAKSQGLTIINHAIYTHDGAYLDTLEIRHPAQDLLPLNEKKYVIRGQGNGSCYEMDEPIDLSLTIAREQECSVTLFNYRNVGNSKGEVLCEEDLATDLIAQIQRLIDVEKADPSRIIIDGFSVSGAVGALVTKHFHDRGIPLNLFSDRSLSSAPKFIEGILLQEGVSGHKKTKESSNCSWFLKLILALTKWSLPAGDAFSALPEENKDYILVRSGKDHRDQHIDDATMTHHASLHEHPLIKAARKKDKQSLKAKLAVASPQDKEAIQGRLDMYKLRKMDMAYCRFPDKNGHHISRADLKSYVNRNTQQEFTGQDYFNCFAYSVFTRKPIVESEDKEVINEQATLIGNGHVDSEFYEDSNEMTSQNNFPSANRS